MTADNVEPISDILENIESIPGMGATPHDARLLAARIREQADEIEAHVQYEIRVQATIATARQEADFERDRYAKLIERLHSQPTEGPILTALQAWLEEQIEPLAQDGTSRRKTWERGFIDGGVAAYRMVVIWLNRHAATTRAERVAEARRVLDFAWKGTTAFNKDSELTRTAEAYVASREKQ